VTQAIEKTIVGSTQASGAEDQDQRMYRSVAERESRKSHAAAVSQWAWDDQRSGPATYLLGKEVERVGGAENSTSNEKSTRVDRVVGNG